jgi:hypothetical protein
MHRPGIDGHDKAALKTVSVDRLLRRYLALTENLGTDYKSLSVQRSYGILFLGSSQLFDPTRPCERPTDDLSPKSRRGLDLHWRELQALQ